MAAVDCVARHGFDPTVADAARARIERELCERHDPRFPYPLKLLTRILPVAMYGGEPAAALDLSAALAALRTEVRSRSQVAALVRRCLRDNPERVLVTAISDPAAARRLDADDRAALERAYGPSRPQARRRLVERSRALRRRQESSSGESSLPRIGLDQVGPARERPELIGLPASGPLAPLDHRRKDSGTPESGLSAESGSGDPVRAGADADGAVEASPPAEVAAAPQVCLSRGTTGGLVYARLAVDIPGLGIEALDDVGLLAGILPESGHGGLGPDKARARIARICDRIVVEPWILARAAPGPDGPGAAHPRALLLLSARSRAADEGMLLRILADAHLGARFDGAARVAAARAHARRRRELTGRGHLHAERIAGARLDPWGAVAERWHGPSALALLARAAGDGNADCSLAERLQHVHRALAAAPCRAAARPRSRRAIDRGFGAGLRPGTPPWMCRRRPRTSRRADRAR